MATILDCRKVQPLLSEYVDGTLQADTAWEVKLHVASCAVCARVADELAATATLLQSLPALEPSKDFAAALARRLADQVLTPKRPSSLRRLTETLVGWWSRPVLRPALASGAALAALVPAALFLTYRAAGGIQPAARPSPAAPTASEGGVVEQLWKEHAAYASAEPLGDPAGLLSTASSVESL
jgi:anti-sigma factor RsiW